MLICELIKLDKCIQNDNNIHKLTSYFQSAKNQFEVRLWTYFIVFVQLIHNETCCHLIGLLYCIQCRSAKQKRFRVNFSSIANSIKIHNQLLKLRKRNIVFFTQKRVWIIIRNFERILYEKRASLLQISKMSLKIHNKFENRSGKLRNLFNNISKFFYDAGRCIPFPYFLFQNSISISFPNIANGSELFQTYFRTNSDILEQISNLYLKWIWTSDLTIGILKYIYQTLVHRVCTDTEWIGFDSLIYSIK